MHKTVSPFAPLALALAITLGACSSTQVATVATAPTPAPAPVPVPAPAPPPAAAPTAPAAPTEAPVNWQLLDAESDRVPGIALLRAERELLAGRAPARTVVVAVIDGGVDTAHVGLRGALWTNAKEVAGNGRDDDGNGFVDDTWGWNFIGGKDGRDVNWDTLELTRLHARCSLTAPTPLLDTLSSAERARCPEIAASFEEKRKELQQQVTQISMVDGMYSRAASVLRSRLAPDSLTMEGVQALPQTGDSVGMARQLFLRMAAAGITGSAIADAKEDVAGRLEYGLNPEFESRQLVGDDPRDLTERRYGNRNVMGPDAKHGSHVAGIVGAISGSGSDGMRGVASGVRIMMVRTVPNGDERDKDVANAIRYAVDNGAQIINMSFGKDYSPEKGVVDEAVRYADARGVLMVHAAGNDAKDLAKTPNFPTSEYLGGGRAANWIEVGASSWQGGDKLAAPFSNYGRAQVDVFAPGTDILSTVPGGGFERQSGTSMAAPVVSGLAAVLMSHFPKLTAADVKRIILESATPYADSMVVRPGSEGERVRFGDLSVTGGVVNAYAAIRAALAGAANVQSRSP